MPLGRSKFVGISVLRPSHTTKFMTHTDKRDALVSGKVSKRRQVIEITFPRCTVKVQPVITA